MDQQVENAIPPGVDIHRPALGIRYPWIELVLRGIKTIEVRNWKTAYRGKLYLYASRQPADTKYAAERMRAHAFDLKSLPRAAVVGEIELTNIRLATERDSDAAQVPAEFLSGNYAWELANPIRYEEPLPALVKPFGSWFYPFARKNTDKG